MPLKLREDDLDFTFPLSALWRKDASKAIPPASEDFERVTFRFGGPEDLLGEASLGPTLRESLPSLLDLGATSSSDLWRKDANKASPPASVDFARVTFRFAGPEDLLGEASLGPTLRESLTSLLDLGATSSSLASVSVRLLEDVGACAFRRTFTEVEARVGA
jgi:hypothetical protein